MSNLQNELRKSKMSDLEKKLRDSRIIGLLLDNDLHDIYNAVFKNIKEDAKTFDYEKYPKSLDIDIAHYTFVEIRATIFNLLKKSTYTYKQAEKINVFNFYKVDVCKADFSNVRFGVAVLGKIMYRMSKEEKRNKNTRRVKNENNRGTGVGCI